MEEADRQPDWPWHVPTTGRFRAGVGAIQRRQPCPGQWPRLPCDWGPTRHTLTLASSRAAGESGCLSHVTVCSCLPSAQADAPFYAEWWFLLVLALSCLVVVLLAAFALVLRGQSRRYSSCGTGGPPHPGLGEQRRGAFLGAPGSPVCPQHGRMSQMRHPGPLSLSSPLHPAPTQPCFQR